ncbi:MAG: glycosyltransferase family 39 protein [Nanoarchaeota archaeon]
MENIDVLDKRSERIKEFFIKKKNWLQYVFLAIIIWIGANIRFKPIRNLIDTTTGKYITLELDSTLWLRYAKYVVENGRLFDIDPMRNVPLGADLSDLGSFTAYFIAYLFKIFNLFIPSITIEFADIIYPIVATIILSVFLFLLVKRLFDWRIALLSVLFINIIPSFLFRSLGGSSDHDILGMMLSIMALYFYVVAWQSTKIRYNILFAAISAIITLVGLKTAGLVTFIFLIIGVFVLIEIFFNKFEDNSFYSFIGWFITVFLIIILSDVEKPLVIYFTSLTTAPVFFAFLAALIHFFIFHKGILRLREKLNFIPSGMFSIVVSTVLVVIFGLSSLGLNFFLSLPDRLVNIFYQFVSNRWITTVAENHVPYVTDWFGQMGKFYVLLFITGSIFLFYVAVKKLLRSDRLKTPYILSVSLLIYFYFLFLYLLQKSSVLFNFGIIIGVFPLSYIIYSSLKEKNYPLFLSNLYGVFISLFIFSRYSTSSIFNGETLISKFAFFGTPIIFIIAIIVAYLYAFYKNRELFNQINQIDSKYFFILLWFIVMIVAATSAVRLLFEFSLVTAIVSSFFVFYVFDFFWKNKNNYLKYFGIILIIVVIFSPFSFGLIPKYYELSMNQANGIGPGYNQLWQMAGKWARENTPEDAVFAHWWDYGYWVQSGFERSTVTDGGNFIGWWNYLMGRYALTGDDLGQLMKFFYAHNVTHFLAISDDIGKYGAYSLIGSDQNFDRLSSIPAFGLDIQNTQETRDGTVFVYTGGAGLDENFIFNGELFPAGGAGIGRFVVPVSIQNGTSAFLQPRALLVYQNRQIEVPIKCIYFQNQKFTFNANGLNACLAIIPRIQGSQINPFGSSLYLSERVSKTFFARMYVGGEEIPGFKLVYDNEGQIPLGSYDVGLFGPIKIWKVSYPEDLTITDEEREYYLQRSYPDPELYLLRR